MYEEVSWLMADSKHAVYILYDLCLYTNEILSVQKILFKYPWTWFGRKFVQNSVLGGSLLAYLDQEGGGSGSMFLVEFYSGWLADLLM